MRLAHDTEARERLRSGSKGGGNGHAQSGSHSPRVLHSPNEIAVVGRDHAAEGALTAALLPQLGARHRVALLGPEAERADGAKAGRAIPAGAAAVFTADGEGYSLLGSGPLDDWNGYDLWNEADIVLVEGLAHSALPKIVVVDPQGAILEELRAEEMGSVIAYVLREEVTPQLRETVRAEAGGRPVFESAEAAEIASCIRDYLARRRAPLYGLVLGGGRSTRMQRDKGSIDYRGEPQVRRAYRLLEGFCERVFVSIRAEQAAEAVFDGLERIHDRFLDLGPMGGILSALHSHPEAAWLVLGCDLPFVEEETLRELVRLRDPLMLATCYDSALDGLPEPLCAIYEPRYRRRLHQFLADGRDCPRKALINSRARHLALADPEALDNINSPEDYRRAVERLRAAQGRQ